MLKLFSSSRQSWNGEVLNVEMQSSASTCLLLHAYKLQYVTLGFWDYLSDFSGSQQLWLGSIRCLGLYTCQEGLLHLPTCPGPFCCFCWWLVTDECFSNLLKIYGSQVLLIRNRGSSRSVLKISVGFGTVGPTSVCYSFISVWGTGTLEALALRRVLLMVWTCLSMKMLGWG